MEIEYIAKQAQTSNESWVRSFINNAFFMANTIQDFEVIFSNLFNEYCSKGDKHQQNAKLFYKFCKTDKEDELSDDDYTEITEGFIIYKSDKEHRVICRITN